MHQKITKKHVLVLVVISLMILGTLYQMHRINSKNQYQMASDQMYKSLIATQELLRETVEVFEYQNQETENVRTQTLSPILSSLTDQISEQLQLSEQMDEPKEKGRKNHSSMLKRSIEDVMLAIEHQDFNFEVTYDKFFDKCLEKVEYTIQAIDRGDFDIEMFYSIHEVDLREYFEDEQLYALFNQYKK